MARQSQRKIKTAMKRLTDKSIKRTILESKNPPIFQPRDFALIYLIANYITQIVSFLV